MLDFHGRKYLTLDEACDFFCKGKAWVLEKLANEALLFYRGDAYPIDWEESADDCPTRFIEGLFWIYDPVVYSQLRLVIGVKPVAEGLNVDRIIPHYMTLKGHAFYGSQRCDPGFEDWFPVKCLEPCSIPVSCDTPIYFWDETVRDFAKQEGIDVPVDSATLPLDVVRDEVTADAVEKATEILSRDRAKPRDIAWAWTILLYVRNGGNLEEGGTTYEGRCREILDKHRWLLSLGLTTTNLGGHITTPMKGVHVSGFVDDVEDRMFVNIADVQEAAFQAKLPWPAETVSEENKKITPKPVVMISEQQDNLIVEALIAEGYTPTALPKWKNNEAGAKAKIKKYLRENQTTVFRSDRIFNKAWERLRTDGRICESS